MKSMKKILVALLTAVAAVAMFTACGSSEGKSDTRKVGIVAMIENGAFTDMRDGIMEQLKAVSVHASA